LAGTAPLLSVLQCSPLGGCYLVCPVSSVRAALVYSKRVALGQPKCQW